LVSRQQVVVVVVVVAAAHLVRSATAVVVEFVEIL
jgi:hypothetical protein